MTPSLLGLNHAADGINAVVMGDFYTGTTYPAKYLNNLFFNDLGQGIVRNIKLSESGQVAGIETFATGAVYVVQIVQGRDGNLYYVDLDDGTIGRWRFVPPATPPSVAMAASVPSQSTLSFDPVDVNQMASLHRSTPYWSLIT